MVKEVYENIYSIFVVLPENPLRELNCYLIKGKERNILIDTGFRRKECLEALQTGLNELNVDMTKTDILLTHMHSDHSGLAPDIASETSRVFISSVDKVYISGEEMAKNAFKDDEIFSKAGIAADVIAKIGTSHAGRRYAADRSFSRYEDIHEGDVFDLGNYKLEAISVPGHTPGNMCFWIESEKIMLTSDHVLFDITPNITKWANFYDSLGAYIESLHKIRKYDVKLPLPAHRKTGDFHARIDELIEHHEFRLGECLNVVAQNPNETAFNIAGLMTWRIRAKNWEDFPMEQKWFAVGECLSHLERLIVEGKVRSEERDGITYYYAI